MSSTSYRSGRWLMLSASLALIAVILGAFGSHALKSVLTAAQLGTFEIAVRYQMYHALALLIITLIDERQPTTWLIWSRRLMLFGIVLFSGSLYLLVALGAGWWAPITPVGGVGLMAGWVLLIVGIWRQSSYGQ